VPDVQKNVSKNERKALKIVLGRAAAVRLSVDRRCLRTKKERKKERKKGRGL
jgi:hypothetical protein